MLLQIGKKLWTKKKENGSSDDKTRGITDALYSASLLRNISKLHWPPSTANHKTREVGKERAALQTRHRPPPNKVSVDSAIYVHISYSILKPRRQKRGEKMCSVDVAWRQCMLEARFHALSFRHLVRVSRNTVGYKQSTDSLFSSPRTR